MSSQETPTDVLIERLVSASGESGLEWLAEVAERMQTLRGMNREIAREVVQEFWDLPVGYVSDIQVRRYPDPDPLSFLARESQD